MISYNHVYTGYFHFRNSHESLHSMDPKVVRSVSVHPLQRQYFAVAESRYDFLFFCFPL